MKATKATAPTAAAEPTTTTDNQQPTTTTAAQPPAAKDKTPEQKAAALRREAGELRRAAKRIGEDTEGGKAALTLATNCETDADAIAPKKTKNGENRPTCKGTKKDGSPCTAHAMEGSEYCTDHRPILSRFSDAQLAAFQRIPLADLVARLGWGVALKMADAQIAAEAVNGEATE